MQKNIGSVSLCIFFFLMLIFPASFQEIRGVLLLILFFFGIQSKKLFEIRYNNKIAVIWVVNIFFSFIFIFNGIIRSTPGAISVSTVFIVWPILYFLFIGFIVEKEQIIPLLKTIIYGGLASSLLILVFVYNNFFGFPLDLTYLVKVQDFGIYWDSGTFEMSSKNLPSVLYCYVFIFTILLIPSKLNHIFVKKDFLIVVLLICTLLIFISARRAFWVVCLLSPFIIIILLKLCKVDLKLYKFIIPVSIFVIVGFFFSTYLGLDKNNIITQLFSFI